MPDATYSREKRMKFAAKLSKKLSPSDSGPLLAHLHDQLFPGLADLPDAMFSPALADLIAPKCSVLPNAAELRKLLLEAQKRTEPEAPPKLAKTYPPIPAWLLAKIREQCGGQPSPLLANWLQTRGADITAWQGRSAG
jgi:hypothetical protein